MFGIKAARRRRTSWVDGGMKFVGDGARHPATWGAALWVALAALAGYSAYRKRDDRSLGRRIVRTVAAKTVLARTRKALKRAKPVLSASRPKRRSRIAARIAGLDE